MGNIVEIFENDRSTCRYEYDALDRLTREDNVAFGKTTTWAYDNNGNIIAKYEYDITTKPPNELHLLDCTHKLYTYNDNSDQLMSYNGEAFVYDAIGNPTTYRGNNATWQYGRQLATYDGNTFTYDARGRRTAKNGITFTYDSNGNLIKQSNGLEFLYDHTGVFAVKYNNLTYFYRKNAQNDIIALLDNNGSVVVKYKYDAWGKCVIDTTTTNTELANINPFRYRSYYFDTETNLYFLKTRYYDPEIGRFMTIDGISYLDPESINGLNLYAYCGDNPISSIDSTGNFAITTSMLIAMAIGAICLGTVGGITAYQSAIASNQTGWELVGSTLSGIFTGMVLGAAVGFIASMGLPYIIGGISGVVAKLIGDTMTSIFTGTNSFGTWESYTVAFIFGGLLKGSAASQVTKLIADILGRPAINQIAKMGTRGEDFNKTKYLYNVAIRGSTYGLSGYQITPYIFGSEISLSLEKIMARSFHNAIIKNITN